MKQLTNYCKTSDKDSVFSEKIYPFILSLHQTNELIDEKKHFLRIFLLSYSIQPLGSKL